jgi:hypothetical protein
MPISSDWVNKWWLIFRVDIKKYWSEKSSHGGLEAWLKQ